MQLLLDLLSVHRLAIIGLVAIGALAAAKGEWSTAGLVITGIAGWLQQPTKLATEGGK